MLSQYLTMAATLKSVNGVNDFGEPNLISKTIQCRLVDRFKEVSNDKGDKVVSSGVVQTTDNIKVGDFVNDKKVIAVTTMVALEGIVGYKGYLL